MKPIQRSLQFEKRSRYGLNSETKKMKTYFFIFFCFFIMTSCQKQIPITTEQTQKTTAEISANLQEKNTEQENVVKMYNDLSPQTLWELQQARAATARYRNIENAIKDGYVDIAVDIQNMGHHFMNAALVDSDFDIRHPEILVYNKNDKGEQELIAVEYAVPLSFPMPEGFSGSGDVWDGTTGFPFWLVHAWVWKYNPDGAFKPLNPLVDLH